MTQNERREFMKRAGLGALAVGLASQTSPAQDAQRMTVGVIGTGGMGGNHTRELASREDINVAYVCDVDKNRVAKAAKEVEERSGHSPRQENDLRKVLDDPKIEAVWIATPDHWHAPAAIMALDAGKHVYVEKPCCHNIREGRLMADAVKRSGKVLQVGTQSRSAPFLKEAFKRLHSGEIGEVLVAKAWNSQRRRSIGKTRPSEPPEVLDYDKWVGPAPMVPYRSNMLHAIWRWWYDFGCGDIGNDGVHDIDVALWGLGIETHPETVTCLGGKYFFDDDQQFPDTQYAICEYPVDGKPEGRKKQLIFEQRDWSPYVQEEYENGAAFYCTEGMLIVGHSNGWRLYGPRNKLIAKMEGRPNLRDHYDNFIAAIRSGQIPAASINEGHRAATIVHLANIAARTGRVLHFDPQQEQVMGDEEANGLVRREYREGHWAVPKEV
jgi:predicted dehydrogenase